MSQIITKFDSNLKKSDIIVPLLSSSKAEAGDNYHDSNFTDKAQTKIFGIQIPLITSVLLFSIIFALCLIFF